METPENGFHSYSANYNEEIIARKREAFATRLAEYHALQNAEEDGIFEVTIRSKSHQATIIVPHTVGTEVALVLWEHTSDRLILLEKQILQQLQTNAEEAACARSQAFFAKQREIQALCLPAEHGPVVPALPFTPRQRPAERVERQPQVATA